MSPSPSSNTCAPLLPWFWSSAFDEASLRRELGALRQKGYGGLLLSPPEMPAGYLGEEWMRRVRLVAHICSLQELVLWLPDDWNMPSGCGELARAGEDFKAWSLRFKTENLTREAAVAWRVPSPGPLATCIAPLENSAVRWHEKRHFLADSKEGPERGIAGFNEDVQVITFFAESMSTDIDRMAPEAAGQFINLTHEAYIPALDSKLFGKTIRGFWTAGPPLPQTEADQLPWSPHLPKAFLEQHGYDLLPHLASLIAPWGEDAAKVRQDFWQTVSSLLIQNWWQPLRDWCEENRLQLALWLRCPAGESFSDLVRSYSDFSSASRMAHTLFVTATDQRLLTRLSASVASLGNQTPPLAVWTQHEPPQDRVSLQQQLWQHGVGGQIAPVEEPVQPFAGALAVWNAELTRVNQWLADSRPAGRVGILLSSRSIWTHYHPRGHRLTRLVWEEFLSATLLLDELHYDFLLVEENDILDASLHGGQLFCGRAAIALDVLVLPGVTAMPWNLWRRLKEFVENGGKVLCLGLLPRWSEKGRDEELEHSVSQTTMLTVADLYKRGPVDIWGTDESSTGFPITRQNESEGRWACYQPTLNPDQDDARLRLRQILKDSMPAPLECQSKSLRFARRETATGNLFFLFNSGNVQELHLRLRATRETAQSALFRRDSSCDSIEPLLVWSSFSPNEGSGFGLDVTPSAGESLWLEWRPETQTHLERASFVVEEYDSQIVRGYATASSAPRLFLQREGRFQSLHGERLALPPPLLLANEWQARRRGPNVWRLNDWFHTGVVENEQVSSPAWHSSFDVLGEAHCASSLSLWAYVNTGKAKLFLNGEALPPANPPFLKDAMWSLLNGTWFSVAPLLCGHNAVDCTLGSAHDMPQVLLVGDFDLNENHTLIAPQNFELHSGSWHEQGFPWYAGEIDYLQTIKVPDNWKDCRIWLELSRVREGVGVRINDTFYGTRLAPPWRFDVTGSLKIGATNTVHLCVWNTLAPLISLKEPPPSGLLGPVRLVAYPLIEMQTQGSA